MQAEKKLTPTQFALLEHLAAVAVRQKLEARRTKKRFEGGWTSIRYDRHVPRASMERLLGLGLVRACCEAEGPDGTVRITRTGVEVLEARRGEEITV